MSYHHQVSLGEGFSSNDRFSPNEATAHVTSSRFRPKRLGLAAGFLSIVAIATACSAGSDQPSALPATDEDSAAEVLDAEEAQLAAAEHPTYFEPVDEELEPELESPDKAVPEALQELTYAGVEIATDDVGIEASDVLAEVVPIDEVTVDVNAVIERDGRRRNETGELFTLDESAALACGDIELALAFADDGDSDAASERIRSAAERVSQSTFDSVSDWGETLSAASEARASDLGSLIGFMTTCTQGGYEL